MSGAFQLRRASEADLPAIMAIERSVFGADAWSEASMLAELRQPHGYYLVAHRPGDEEVLAYAGLFAPERLPTADIQTIAVVPHARRNGLGRVLVLQLIGEARRRGAREVFLEVRADNEGAHALYRELGFVELAVRQRYYRDGMDARIMRLDVAPPRTEPA